MIGLEGGGDYNPRSPVSKNRINHTNHILVVRLTWKMLLPRWDLTTTFVRALPIFLLLVVVLAVVLLGCDLGSPASKNKGNYSLNTSDIKNKYDNMFKVWPD